MSFRSLGDSAIHANESISSPLGPHPPPTLPQLLSQMSSSNSKKRVIEAIGSSAAKQSKPKCLPKPCAFAHVPYNRSRFN